jgi:hypothetical protein
MEPTIGGDVYPIDFVPLTIQVRINRNGTLVGDDGFGGIPTGHQCDAGFRHLLYLTIKGTS